jgi:hypothetical protein
MKDLANLEFSPQLKENDSGYDSELDAESATESSAHRVSLWEIIGITIGAALLIVAGLLGLGVKALGNAFNPERAEAIARSLMHYEIAGGSHGFFGANIGGGKLAVVTSNTRALENQSAPAVELFLARMPLPEAAKAKAGVETDDEPEPANELFSGFSFSYQDMSAFQVSKSEMQQRAFCGATVPVEISTGQLLLSNGGPALPAVKYEVTQVLDTESRVITISALGVNAAAQAEQTFASLKCLEVLP